MCYYLKNVRGQGKCYCEVSHGDTVRSLKLDCIKEQFDEEQEMVSVE